VGDEGAEVDALARSISARRQACEQYGPVDSLSQARQKSWKQSMIVVGMMLVEEKKCRGSWYLLIRSVKFSTTVLWLCSHNGR
jgi:hypothetical protein